MILSCGLILVEVAEEAAIGGVGAARDQVGLVDQHQVGTLDRIGLLVDRLDAGEQDLRLDVAAV